MNRIKPIALCTAAALLLCAATACDEKTSSPDGETATTTTTKGDVSMTDSTASAAVPAGDPDWKPADASLGLKTLASKECTDEMLARGVLSVGNTARLANVMKRAKAGEFINIATIGGSITQGTAASSSNERYASRVLEWWSASLPKAQLSFTNAGIGATDSYIGVHRVDTDVIAQKADVVVVEFSVNDTNEFRNLRSYDSLVRKLLNSERQPAVILLFTTQENGTSLQETHRKVGDAYDLPMLSYKNMVLPEISAGSFTWKDISPDNIHPNTKGHTMIGELVWAYLNSVLAQVDEIDTSNLAFTTPALTEDLYADAKLLDNTSVTAEDATGFAPDDGSGFYQFPNGWTSAAGGSLSFRLTGRSFGLMYLRTTDGESGTYEVWVDDQKVSTLNGDFPKGWGNYAESTEFFTSDTAAEHVVVIKPAAGSEGKKFSVLGLLVS